MEVLPKIKKSKEEQSELSFYAGQKVPCKGTS